MFPAPFTYVHSMRGRQVPVARLLRLPEGIPPTAHVLLSNQLDGNLNSCKGFSKHTEHTGVDSFFRLLRKG